MKNYRIHKNYHTDNIGYNLELIQSNKLLYIATISKKQILDLCNVINVHEFVRNLLHQRIKELE